ncbi:MAG: hypothetical protein WCH34_13565 [Bacteroidota bacterium]
MKPIFDSIKPENLILLEDNLKKKQQEDFWNTLPESQKEEILDGIQQVNNEEIVDYEEFIIKHRK